MKVIVYLFMLLFLVSCVLAATIHGSIYDISLNKMKDVIVEINTEPKQQYISKNGTYSFNVPIGEYAIEAKHYMANLLESSATEGISVKSEGSFVLDLILFPTIDSELIEEGEEINLEDDYFKEKNNYLLISSVVIIVIVLLILYFIIKKKVTKREVKEEVSKKEEDYYDKVLSIIKENKRVTQKEIRKQIPLSEAKISLIITELEHKGLVEKIKRGRGNILILRDSL